MTSDTINGTFAIEVPKDTDTDAFMEIIRGAANIVDRDYGYLDPSGYIILYEITESEADDLMRYFDNHPECYPTYSTDFGEEPDDW